MRESVGDEVARRRLFSECLRSILGRQERNRVVKNRWAAVDFLRSFGIQNPSLA
jgi:hypothetical protein